MDKTGILIVDDSENIREILMANFDYLGYDVRTARDGEEALGMIAQRKPDVVVLDVMMPRQNGFQVCRRIKADPSLAGIPVVILTAKGQAEDRYWGKDCGADEYLTKPFSTSELERLIERLVKGKAMVRNTFDSAVAAHRAAGESFAIIGIDFDARALNVFRQKYGEPRFFEALDAIRQTIDVIVRGATGGTPAWSGGERGGRAAIACGADEARSLRDRIVAQSNLLLRSYYDAVDAGRGYVVTRHPGDSSELHVPLLTVDASLSIEPVRRAS
jgi:twitching motility two-component system response regulator PilH